MTTPKSSAANGITLTAFAIQDAARWDQECLVAPMPANWLDRLEAEYWRLEHVQRGYSLPTRGLEEIIFAVDPAVMHVGSPRSDAFIVAFPGVDRSVLSAAVAAWATTQITSRIDWFHELDPDNLAFTPQVFNVLQHSSRRNGTAAPAVHVYDMLPTFIAKHIADAGLVLLGKPRELILGPPQRNNRRDAVLWPPVRIDGKGIGDGLVAAKISFHVETVPNHPRPHLHADLTLSRFPLNPVTYVPSRNATLWLHAPNGFLRQNEPHTLLAAHAERRRGPDRDGPWQWRWGRGLGEALARLTHLPFPAPDKVFAQPAIAADEGAIRAYVLYSGGTKSEAIDEDTPGGTLGRSKSLRHAAHTGFVPGDHVEVHRRLEELLEPLDIRPTGRHVRVGPRFPRKIKVDCDPMIRYVVELWTHNDSTKKAVLATLEHCLGLKRTDDGADPRFASYSGDLTLVLLFRDGTSFAAGIRPDDGKAADVSRNLYANQVERHLGACPEPRVAILELGDNRHFARLGRIDPKSSLKKAFARSGRSLQCLQPATPIEPTPPVPKQSSGKRPNAYPGTEFDTGTIHRCSAAIHDALRQLGRVGSYVLPADLPRMEHIGVWLHTDGRAALIPLVIRHNGVDEPTALLAEPAGVITLPYHRLPHELARGRGRIKPGPEAEATLAEFLVNALGIGETAHAHDRIVFVRSSSFRFRGWDWLQDKHLTPDVLVRPGVKIDAETVPAALTPDDCPGLRIVRIREAGSQMEVAGAFSADSKAQNGRISGLFKFNERVYYAINPRPNQMQTRLDNTKLDPDLRRNFTRMVTSPRPLELTVALKQPHDDADTIAALTARLRRAHAHTGQNSDFPGVLHLCSLASEYI